jgi:hypothetical protein
MSRRVLVYGISVALVIFGGVWLIIVPKKSDLLAPDMAISMAIGVALIGTGLLTLAMRGSWTGVRIMAMALLWSVLLNGVSITVVLSLRTGLRLYMETDIVESKDLHTQLESSDDGRLGAAIEQLEKSIQNKTGLVNAMN